MKRKPTQTRNAAETKLRHVNVSKATGLGSVVAQYSYSGMVKWFATGYRVPVSFWNETKQEIRPGGVDDVAKANAHLKTVKNNLDSIIRTYIQQHGEKPTILHLEAQYEALKAPAASKVAPQRTSVLEALKSFIETKTKEVKPNSIKAYSALSQNITAYYAAKGISWDLETLTLSHFDAFQDWLTSVKKFHNTTVERRVIAMKKFLEGHKDSVGFPYKELKPKHPAKAAKNLVVITLSTDELKALEAIDLTGHPRMHRVQQAFLLQCWTGLRVSDVVRLNSTHIDGATVRIDINKTGDFSAVPLFPTAERILADLGPEPISVSNQEYNRVLKDVIKTLAQSVPSLLAPITQLHAIGKTKAVTTKPKWAWITTHTARRTFITMCIEMGIQQHFVMRWSNHSDPRSFRKYQNAMQGETDAARQLIAAFNA